MLKEFMEWVMGMSPKLIVPPSDGNALVAIPGNYQLHKLEFMMPRPSRKRGVVTFATVEGFCRYVKAHCGPGTIILCAKGDGALQMRAVLDGHEPNRDGLPGLPGWKEHVAACHLVRTSAFMAWQKAHEKVMSQAEFAEFVENRSLDFREPSAGAMLELAQTLEMKKGVSFRAGYRVQNGQTQLRHEEQIEAKAGEKDTLDVPGLFTVGIRVFEGLEAYKLRVALRYRITDGKLTFRCTLMDLDALMDGIFDETSLKVLEATGIAPMHGVMD